MIWMLIILSSNWFIACRPDISPEICIVNNTKTRTALIYLDEAGILHIQAFNGAVLDYEDALDNYLVIKHITNDQPVLRLTDFRGKFHIKNKARKWIKGREVKDKTIARSVLVKGPIKLFLYKMYFLLTGTSGPTKLFTDYQKACKWLLSYK